MGPGKSSETQDKTSHYGVSQVRGFSTHKRNRAYGEGALEDMFPGVSKVREECAPLLGVVGFN